MSVKAMAWVWDQDITRDKKFILLAYADHADHDGYNIFPAVDTVARKTGYTRRSVQLITKKIIESGLLIPEGKSKYQTNKYRIPIYGGENISPPTNGDDAKGVKILQGGVKNTTENMSQISPNPSLTVIKPSLLKNKEQNAWTTLIEHYKNSITTREWNVVQTFVQCTWLEEQRDGVMVVGCETEYQRDWLTGRFKKEAERFSAGIDGKGSEIEFVCELSGVPAVEV